LKQRKDGPAFKDKFDGRGAAVAGMRTYLLFQQYLKRDEKSKNQEAVSIKRIF